jgi:hypothetical protein
MGIHFLESSSQMWFGVKNDPCIPEACQIELGGKHSGFGDVISPTRDGSWFAIRFSQYDQAKRQSEAK